MKSLHAWLYYNITTLLGRNIEEIDKMYFYKNNNYFFDIR